MSIIHYQFSIITPLAIHETTHVNQMDTKDDLAEMKTTGINSAEENLAEHVEDRISDKIDTDSEKFTAEEMDEYLNGLEAENEEKGREQKSLEQGTEAAKDVSEENKENNAIPFDFVFSPSTLGGEEKITITDPKTGKTTEIWMPAEESSQLKEMIVGGLIGEGVGYLLGKGYKVVKGAFIKETVEEVTEYSSQAIKNNVKEEVINEVIETPRSGGGVKGEGSGNKVDFIPPIYDESGNIIKEFPHNPQAHGFSDIVDNYAGKAEKTILKDGAELYQIEGSLNGVDGRFEWIIDKGKVTHRMFINGGKINGVPIKK